MQHGDSAPHSGDSLRHEPAGSPIISVYDPDANVFAPLSAVYPEIALYVYERGHGAAGCGQILGRTEFLLDPARDLRIKGNDGAVRATAALAAQRASTRVEPALRNRIRPYLQLTEPPPEPPPPPEPWQ
jgi:hypothetical protein